MTTDMSWEHLARRVIHLCTPVFLVYYWLPSPVWSDGPSKEFGLVFLLLMVFLFEIIRRVSGIKVFGLRSYERWRMASYAWAALGLTIVFLTMPFEIALPSIIGMSWVDPLIGELRERKADLYPLVPIAVYFSIMLISLTILIGLSPWVFVASAASAPVAIWVEKQRFWKMDDDMTMMVMPAILIWSILTLTQVL